MQRWIKADFHLHTYHSDNRDRMTPQDYVTLGRRLGYDVLGFCDHHHNLTQAAWQALQAEVADLADSSLLLTTGYEATFVTGHLCVLDKQLFDGESVADCRRQLWSPANTRILAHPDNNACAWLLPLPVGVQGVEVINGGQDLYAYHPTSPCNGLPTYMRYLLLNHPVAAVAQSDCHARALFGRVWTGLALPIDAPLTWVAVQDALHRGRTFASMGDLTLRVWTESGASLGDTLAADGDHDLFWEVAPGSEVTVYVADRPVAYIAPAAQPTGRYRIQHNGPHWLLAKRGLAWAVSSPIWVQNQPGAAQDARARLAADSALQAAADPLRRCLDWLQTLQPAWPHSSMPVAAYAAWLNSLIPEQWSDQDWGWNSASAPVDLAHARLAAARQIAAAVLADVIGANTAQMQAGLPAPRMVIATSPHGTPGGLLQFTVDVPRDWAAITLADATGRPLPHLAQTIDGPRDPIDGPRTRVQIEEICVWLAHGEMHEYVLTAVRLERTGSRLTLQIDLYPQALGLEPRPDLAAADALRAAIATPEITHFDVHLRMPRRFAVVTWLDAIAGADRCVLHVQPAAQENGPTPPSLEPAPPAADILAHDPADSVMVVQVA